MAAPPRSGAARADGTQTVQRAAALLRTIASHNRGGLRVVDVCRMTGLNRPAAHRLLQCLAREHLLVRSTRTRNYHLGPLLYELGLTAAPSVRLEQLCRSHIKALADLTGDMVFLTLRSGYDAVCIDRQEGAFWIRTYTLEVGTRRPLGIGAGSLAILSGLPDDEIRDIISFNSKRLEAYNGLTAKKLSRMVMQSKQRGYAVHDGAVSGARAIGVAIRDGSGAPTAAVSVSGVASRMQVTRWSELVPLMREQVAKIETVLAR